MRDEGQGDRPPRDPPRPERDWPEPYPPPGPESPEELPGAVPPSEDRCGICGSAFHTDEYHREGGGH
jgi:hypothetical protein